ncbi:hypothetical protein I215_05000 [Galbibacter marinus]|uniref:Uncharacterized protein n=2 Tax=Galbibacter marinus TaxID=555500 RepID=K2QM29_9FLAO|nr:hypothetical protein I215_05000 [Galbibacter marinus]
MTKESIVAIVTRGTISDKRNSSMQIVPVISSISQLIVLYLLLVPNNREVAEAIALGDASNVVRVVLNMAANAAMAIM